MCDENDRQKWIVLGDCSVHVATTLLCMLCTGLLLTSWSGDMSSRRRTLRGVSAENSHEVNNCHFLSVISGLYKFGIGIYSSEKLICVLKFKKNWNNPVSQIRKKVLYLQYVQYLYCLFTVCFIRNNIAFLFACCVLYGRCCVCCRARLHLLTTLVKDQHCRVKRCVSSICYKICRDSDVRKATKYNSRPDTQCQGGNLELQLLRGQGQYHKFWP